MGMNFHLITLFPAMFDSYLGESIIARATREKKVAFKFYNPRDFVPKKVRKGKDGNYAPVDDKPYGGGPGMVMQAEPVLKAVAKAIGKKNIRKVKIISLAPSGKMFTNEIAQNFVQKYTDVVIICGRYEGIDARVKKIFKTEDFSIGPYVLTGGELPAMVMIDAMSRQIEGVLGNFNSLEESRVSSSEVYTRPEILEFKGKKHRVPKVLLSGDHKKIEAWKQGIKTE